MVTSLGHMLPGTVPAASFAAPRSEVAELKGSFVWKFCSISAICCRELILQAGLKFVGVKLWQEHGTESEASVLPNPI